VVDRPASLQSVDKARSERPAYLAFLLLAPISWRSAFAPRIVELTAPVVAKGAEAIDPRGGLYTHANIGERLAMRNFLVHCLRQSTRPHVGQTQVGGRAPHV